MSMPPPRTARGSQSAVSDAKAPSRLIDRALYVATATLFGWITGTLIASALTGALS